MSLWVLARVTLNDKHSKLWLCENEEEEEVINSQFYEFTELYHPKLMNS